MGWLGRALVVALATASAASSAEWAEPAGSVAPDTSRGATAPPAGLAGADTAAAVSPDSLYQRAVAAGAALAPRDQRVLAELLAAGREMQTAGDPEAALLLFRDALDYVEERRR